MVSVDKWVQPEKTGELTAPMVVQFFALKLILVMPVQSEKAEYQIAVTESGMVTDVKLVQPWNALFPIVVTELGIDIDVRLVQSLNVPSSMTFMELDKATDFRLVHP